MQAERSRRPLRTRGDAHGGGGSSAPEQPGRRDGVGVFSRRSQPGNINFDSQNLGSAGEEPARRSLFRSRLNEILPLKEAIEPARAPKVAGRVC